MTQKDWHVRIKGKYPLLCRGWAFQERVLARRNVHFTALELTWECMEARYCMCEDQGGWSGKINNMNWALRESRTNPNLAKTTLMWRECVKSFSKRDLTMLDDRLFAIDGIASYIRGSDSSAYRELYLHGLWKDVLPWDLLWYCDQTSLLTYEKSRDPSYSWSSVDCGIEWPACDHWGPEERFSPAISTGTCMDFYYKKERKAKESKLCEVISIDGDNITIVSRTAPVLIKLQNTPQGLYWTVLNIESDDGRTLPFYPDIQLVTKESHDRLMYNHVEIASAHEQAAVRQIGLIVRRRQGETGAEKQVLFERVGIAGDITCNLEHGSRAWFANEEKRCITLR